MSLKKLDPWLSFHELEALEDKVNDLKIILNQLKVIHLYKGRSAEEVQALAQEAERLYREIQEDYNRLAPQIKKLQKQLRKGKPKKIAPATPSLAAISGALTAPTYFTTSNKEQALKGTLANVLTLPLAYEIGRKTKLLSRGQKVSPLALALLAMAEGAALYGAYQHAPKNLPYGKATSLVPLVLANLVAAFMGRRAGSKEDKLLKNRHELLEVLGELDEIRSKADRIMDQIRSVAERQQSVLSPSTEEEAAI